MTLEIDATVRIGRFEVHATFEVARGETVALAGPNGAGKTTLLRAIAGLEPLAAGQVRLDGAVLEDPADRVRLPSADRGMGVVFQQPLLFPHLSARANVAFGARRGGAARAAADRDAEDWLERLGVAGSGPSRPHELSAGEAQRVALARALASGPRCLLLDEPLAALDVEARQDVRRELHRHLADFVGPRLLVTHDPLELAALADRVVVLEDGRVVQVGAVSEVTARPRSRWAARLAGVNLLRGEATTPGQVLVGEATVVAATTITGPVLVAIPPNAVALYRTRPEGTPRNAWRVRVVSMDHHGDRVRVQLAGEVALVAEVTPAAVAARSLVAGGELWAVVKATEIEVYAD